MQLRPVHYLALFFLVGVFFGGLRLHHYLTQPREFADEPRRWNSLERGLDAATVRAGAGRDLLQAAMADPEAVLGGNDEGGGMGNAAFAHAAGPDSPEADDPLPDDEPPSVSGFQDLNASAFPASSPSVEGTQRMYASFASLHRPEVADPDSELNQALRARMEAMRGPVDMQPPVPYGQRPATAGAPEP